MDTPLISIRGLRKSYGSGYEKNEVLKGITLDISPGQIIGYIGPNGSGKSTTVKILCGILTDFEGEIEVFGLDVRKNRIAIKKRIGYVPENCAIYDLLTPRAYLDLIASLYDMDFDKAGDRATQLLSFFGMEAHADQRMDTFSKGMKQKILIIAGIINNPDILYLDEPLSGLDANAVILVKELLTRFVAGGKTVFYCSHLMDIVEKISDRILLLHNGIVVADGSFEELKTGSADTLERLFAQLTGNEDQGNNADELFRTLNEQ